MKPADASRVPLRLAGLLLVLLCMACRSHAPAEETYAPPPVPESPDTAVAAPPVERVFLQPMPRVEPANRQSPIDYLAGLTRLDPVSARVELERLESTILEMGEDGDCSVECTRLALLLSTGVADVPRNVERSLRLLERALASQSNDILQQSYLIFAQLWEQHLTALSRIDGLAARVDEQKRLIDVLRQQIEELTALEQRLINREEELQP